MCHRRLWVGTVSVIGAVVCADYRPAAAIAAPQHTAVFLPTPPQQNAPWSPPTGSDAEGFTPALLKALQTLFVQGLADPRGGTYQAFTVRVGSVWTGGGATVETHGWVLPAPTIGPRFAVCWNGLVYPIIALKGAASLDADILSLQTNAQKQASQQDSEVFQNVGRATPEAADLSLVYPSLLHVAYLIRLGKYDAARNINTAAQGSLLAAENDRQVFRRDPYLHLATLWAGAAYERAVCAHMRGDDRLTLADAELLSRATPLMEAEAAKRGYRQFPNGGIYPSGSLYLPFLKKLSVLQQDAARRVAEPARPPLDMVALKKQEQTERIAQLIRRLDEVDVRQWGQPGEVNLDIHPVCEALIAEGAAAVEPLLRVIQQDNRLTRSVAFGRDFFRERYLLSVKGAAFACFLRITDATELVAGSGMPSAVVLRDWWTKNKNKTRASRWFEVLASDGPPMKPAPPLRNETRAEYDAWQREKRDRAHQNRALWEDAAKRIMERADVQHSGQGTTIIRQPLGAQSIPIKGEELRVRRNPSVSDLLQKRALQLSEPEQGKWGFDYTTGATLALILYEWEPHDGQTLPTLQKVMQRCIDFQNKEPKTNSSDQYHMGELIARLTLARVRLGDEQAAEEYGAWLQTVSPRYLGFGSRSALLALWREPKNPALERVGNRLFQTAETAPTPWNQLLVDPKSPDNYIASELFVSDLLRLPTFRQMVLLRLTDETPVGIVKPTGVRQQAKISWFDGSGQGTEGRNKLGREQTLRVCDRCALALQRLAGIPIFDALDPVAQRDAQCAVIRDYLVRYGPQLRWTQKENSLPLYDGTGVSFDTMGPAFSVLSRPAIPDDVRANQTIFALTNAQTRIVPELFPLLPVQAQWNNDPPSMQESDNKPSRISSGWVWQAEDVYDGKNWIRYYGYVGPHFIGKVPASEVRITDWRVPQPVLHPSKTPMAEEKP